MQRVMPRMRRRFLAATFVVGATVPLLLTTLFVVGCCVLPFHGVMHETLPLCHVMAQQAAHDDAQPAAPAREKEPVKRVLVTLTAPVPSRNVVSTVADVSARTATAYRSFITLGALRCDQDVGLHVSLATFLI